MHSVSPAAKQVFILTTQPSTLISHGFKWRLKNIQLFLKEFSNPQQISSWCPVVRYRTGWYQVLHCTGSLSLSHSGPGWRGEVVDLLEYQTVATQPRRDQGPGLQGTSPALRPPDATLRHWQEKPNYSTYYLLSGERDKIKSFWHFIQGLDMAVIISITWKV